MLAFLFLLLAYEYEITMRRGSHGSAALKGRHEPRPGEPVTQACPSLSPKHVPAVHGERVHPTKLEVEGNRAFEFETLT